MPLMDDGTTPRDYIPKCIVVKPVQGVVLNSVGLSGPGAMSLVRRWCDSEILDFSNPYFISFMSVAPTAEERIGEAKEFADLLDYHRDEMPGEFGLQLNLSCPNVGIDPAQLMKEAENTLDIFRPLRLPLAVKLNALVPPDAAAVMADHPACDAVVCSNTIPWGKLPDRIDWKGIFKTEESPLKSIGGGGLSGAPLVPIVRDWVSEARKFGMYKPIVAGGGILSKNDAETLIRAGADAVEIGSVSMLRPWRVKSIIEYCNFVLGAWRR